MKIVGIDTVFAGELHDFQQDEYQEEQRRHFDMKRVPADEQEEIRKDIFEMCDEAADAVPIIMERLREGRIAGQFSFMRHFAGIGPCGCFYATAAMTYGDQKDYGDFRGARYSRYGEQWFGAIWPGDTPKNATIAKFAYRAMLDWKKARVKS